MAYRFDPALAMRLDEIQPSDFSDLDAVRAAIHGSLAGVDRQVDSRVTVRDGLVAGLGAEPMVKVRVYRPAVADEVTPLPAILHAHAGGFVVGELASSHTHCLELAHNLGAVVVSVDYRLAPENPYPCALYDVLAAWQSLLSNDEIAVGVDRSRIALHGISAGAGLVAAAALYARDHAWPSARFQYLSVPVLDDRLTSASMLRFTDTPKWDSGKARISWDAYLDGVRRGGHVPPYAAPARAASLVDLPSAYISVMEFDPLRDEGIAYAARLLEAGISVELHVFPGTFHCSFAFSDAAVSVRELAEEMCVLRAAIGQ
jgi:acetyl esterase/lipase